jgi:hypothetical protein
MKPAFVTVIIARPLAAFITAGGIPFSGIASNRSTIAAACSTSDCIASRGETVEHAPSSVKAPTNKIILRII